MAKLGKCSQCGSELVYSEQDDKWWHVPFGAEFIDESSAPHGTRAPLQDCSFLAQEFDILDIHEESDKYKGVK